MLPPWATWEAFRWRTVASIMKLETAPSVSTDMSSMMELAELWATNATLGTRAQEPVLHAILDGLCPTENVLSAEDQSNPLNPPQKCPLNHPLNSPLSLEIQNATSDKLKSMEFVLMSAISVTLGIKFLVLVLPAILDGVCPTENVLSAEDQSNPLNPPQKCPLSHLLNSPTNPHVTSVKWESMETVWMWATNATLGMKLLEPVPRAMEDILSPVEDNALPDFTTLLLFILNSFNYSIIIILSNAPVWLSMELNKIAYRI